MEYHYGMLFKSIMKKEGLEAEEKRVAEEQAAIDKERAEMPFNFKLWLMEGFVRINEWERLDEILGGLYDYRVDMTIHKPLLESMFNAFHWFLEPLYAPHSKSKYLMNRGNTNIDNRYSYYADEQSPSSLKQATTPTILFSEITKILKPLGIYIAYDIKLFQKLCIVLRHNMHEDLNKAILIAGEVLLPALALVENNNQIADELWEILK
jgi:hypothetical protein